MSEKMKYERATPAYDVVDTQAHIGPGGIEETLASMNALGVSSLLIDEFWISFIASGKFEPVQRTEGGCVRPLCPTAELASRLHPERFGYQLRVAFNDPEAESIIRTRAADPGCKAFRVEPGMSPLTVEAYAKGAYDRVFAAVANTGKPVCVYLPDHPELIAVTAGKFPGLTLIVDHCGLYSNSNRATFRSPYQDLDREQTERLYDEVLALGKHPNVVMKWSHGSENFEHPVFPGEGLRAYLRRAIDAFGADRIIWASDFSVNQRKETWAELLYGMLTNSDLSVDEKTAILGANARRLLKW